MGIEKMHMYMPFWGRGYIGDGIPRGLPSLVNPTFQADGLLSYSS